MNKKLIALLAIITLGLSTNGYGMFMKFLPKKTSSFVRPKNNKKTQRNASFHYYKDKAGKSKILNVEFTNEMEASTFLNSNAEYVVAEHRESRRGMTREMNTQVYFSDEAFQHTLENQRNKELKKYHEYLNETGDHMPDLIKYFNKRIFEVKNLDQRFSMLKDNSFSAAERRKIYEKIFYTLNKTSGNEFNLIFKN